MNEIMKKLISLFIVVCTISNLSYAATRPTGAKGTVSGSGTDADPYKLILGESIIDMYYDESTGPYICFEFVGGNYNAALYNLGHNPDKQRIRLTLQNTDESILKVKAEEGINYLQAGAESVSLSVENAEENLSGDNKSEDKYNPYYNIASTEIFTANRNDGKSVKIGHSVDLGLFDISGDKNLNLFERTLFVFSKSNLPYETAYKFSDEQLKNGKVSYKFYNDNGKVDYTAYGKFENGNTIKEINNEIGSSDTQYIDNSYSNFGSVRVLYKFNGLSSEVADSEDETANPLEQLITKVFIAIGDLFVKITGLGGFGKEACITIDSLVFNEYPNTIVDFFGDIGYTNTSAKGVIEFWFKVFKAWAIIIYIVLLVYIGIKTILVSGTSEQKKVKGMLEGWLEGVLLLFFLPFLFKYLIVINDAVVDILRVNSKYSVHAYYTFENMYQSLGGQEDGEDSTTSILGRLKNARQSLEKEIDNLEASRDRLKNTLQKMQEEIQNSGYFNKELVNRYIDMSKSSIQKYLKDNNLTIDKNGITYTTDKLDEELTVVLKNFFSNEQNRTNFVNNKSVELAISDNNDLKVAIEEYSKGLNIVSNNGTGVSSEVMTEIVEQLYILTANILPRECSDIILENMKNYSNIQMEEMNQVQKELDNIDIAILKLENNDADIMGAMRQKAGETGRVFYLIIWYIMIFEVIILLVLYYKRLFMLMALIAIFPLVTLAYAYEKAKNGKAGILKNWTQEYIVNVFIQSIHAILYVTLVESGYSIYIADNDNWLIFVLAVIGLISIEPVFKNIIGLKGSTVSDLTKYGASAAKASLAATALVGTFKNTGKDLERIENASKNREAVIQKKEARDDKRRSTSRLERDNKIRKDSSLTNEEKQRKLNEYHNRDKQSDIEREKERKEKARKRLNKRRRQMNMRVIKNVSGTFGAVTGGLAAGGQLEDFATAAGFANIISGTGQKVDDLTDDAKKLDEKAKAASKTTVNNDSTATPPTPENGGAGGNGYDGGNGKSQEPIIADDIKYGNRLSVKSPQLANTFAQRLKEEKVHVKKNLSIIEEDE